MPSRNYPRKLAVALVFCLAAAFVYAQLNPPPFIEARRHFTTHLTQNLKENVPVDTPPAGMFDVVEYPSPVGQLAAYLSPDPKDGKRHPVVIWIAGGFSNSISSVAWDDAAPTNDQSGSAFRKAGLAMMYPSMRGGNQNPGFKEGLYGEVDDVIAAADFLSKQAWVDPNRIYLGGHSTGGTLVLLVSECCDRFRAVFSFGPTTLVTLYGQENLPFDITDKLERHMRAPMSWLRCIKNPVFVFEGKDKPGNAVAVARLQQLCKNPLVQFHLVAGATHFTTLAPITKLLAKRVLHDDGPRSTLSFTDDELNALFSK